MAIDVHLISKRGSAPPTTLSFDVRMIAANLYLIDRKLKKAGRPELKPFFGSDDETWQRPRDVASAFESARAFFSDDSLDELDDMFFEVVAEELGSATEVLRAFPKGSVIRLVVIKKPRNRAKSKPARTRSSALAAARSASAIAPGIAKSSLKLTAKQREYVQSLLERYRCDADLWAFTDIERKARLAEIDKYSGQNWLECLRRNLREQHPELNDDECEAAVEMSLFSTDLLKRGVARRIAFNMLSDLRAALSLPARMGLLSALRSGCRGGVDYPVAWDLLHTLAAKDMVVVRRFFEVNNTPLKGPGNRSAILIYNAMLAIVTQNEAQQQKLVGPLA